MVGRFGTAKQQMGQPEAFPIGRRPIDCKWLPLLDITRNRYQASIVTANRQCQRNLFNLLPGREIGRFSGVVPAGHLEFDSRGRC